MIKITSKDIQEASKVFRKFLNKVIQKFENTDDTYYFPDDKALAKKFGLTYLGAGVYRVAYKYKNIVIKTHLGYQETENITTEYNVWKEHKQNVLSAVLNPILYCELADYKGSRVAFSISPYVIPLDNSKDSDRHKHYGSIRNYTEDAICDGHSGNLGILNKLPVLIDYQDSFNPYFGGFLSPTQMNLIRKQYKFIQKLCLKASA